VIIRRRTVSVRFTRLHQDARAPEQAHPNDAGYDLFATDGVQIGPGERAAVGTGIAISIPDGHAGLVMPRSGLAVRHGIALVNAPGLIDSGYRGEVRVLVLNTDPEERFVVEPGDRIAQLVITSVASAEFVEGDILPQSARGEAGFGSTGVR
jgi:dUTP pyrophosphatase